MFIFSFGFKQFEALQISNFKSVIVSHQFELLGMQETILNLAYCVCREIYFPRMLQQHFTLSVFYTEDILKYIWYIGLVYFYPIYRDSGSCFWNLIFLCFHVISLNKNVVFSILHSLINCWHGFAIKMLIKCKSK